MSIVDILRRKELSDIETVLVVVTLYRKTTIRKDEVVPVLKELLGDRYIPSVAKALILMEDDVFMHELFKEIGP